MKKLGIYVMMLAMMMAVTFVGCNSDEEDPILTKPVITIGVEKITIDLKDLGALAVPVAVTSDDADLTSVKVFVMVGVGETATPYELETIIDFGENAKVWAKTYTAADFDAGMLGQLPEGVTLTFNVEAQAKAETGEELVADPKSVAIEIVGQDVPLSEAVAFTWITDGATKKAEGLDQFGLKWDGTNYRKPDAHIKKDKAAKFVDLKNAVNSNWTTVATQEALKDLIDKASDMEEYLMDANASHNELNDILGVIYEGEYYILHITKTTAVYTEGVGTKVTAIGEFKK